MVRMASRIKRIGSSSSTTRIFREAGGRSLGGMGEAAAGEGRQLGVLARVFQPTDDAVADDEAGAREELVVMDLGDAVHEDRLADDAAAEFPTGAAADDLDGGIGRVDAGLDFGVAREFEVGRDAGGGLEAV